ncbi:MAG: cupin domain-containing protein, partial [Pseudomonadota bacterium]
LKTGAPQIIVPEGHWQAARSTGAYTLVSCTVSPGFQFEGFTLAPPGFEIPR